MGKCYCCYGYCVVEGDLYRVAARHLFAFYLAEKHDLSCQAEGGGGERSVGGPGLVALRTSVDHHRVGHKVTVLLVHRSTATLAKVKR